MESGERGRELARCEGRVPISFGGRSKLHVARMWKRIVLAGEDSFSFLKFEFEFEFEVSLSHFQIHSK